MKANLEIAQLAFIDHLLFFFLAILLPVLGFISSKGIENFSFDRETKLNLYYSNGFFLWITAGVMLTSWNFYERSFVDLGFSTPLWNGMVLLLTISFALLYLLELFSKKLFQLLNKKMDWAKNLRFLPENGNEFKHYLFLVVAAGFCEEVLFRGFLINYLYTFFDGGNYALWLAIILPAIFFSLGHIYQGAWAVAKITIGSIILSGIYLWSGSLYIVILLHIFVDIISALYARFLINKEEQIFD